MTTNIDELQSHAAEWCVRSFGWKSYSNRKERAMRVLEEALELAQSEGVTHFAAEGVIDHVYRRPMGVPQQEAAGVGVCLLIWANNKGLSLRHLIHGEMQRVLALPADHFRKRHDEKIAAGLSVPRD